MNVLGVANDHRSWNVFELREQVAGHAWSNEQENWAMIEAMAERLQ